MLHEMKLNENPFERMKNGTKTIEFRLNDEKRKKIKIGDKITFSKLPGLCEKLTVEVLELYNADTFENLFLKLYNDSKIAKEKAKVMHEIYSEAKEKEFGDEDSRELERVVMLKVVDQKWMDHIDNMDELKNGIGLRAYGQKDPVVQYRIEGFDMFDEMINDIKDEVTKILLHIQKKEGVTRKETAKITNASLEDTAINLVDGNLSEKEGGMNKTVVNKEPKVGRNDPCPCGSGKKYKNCCGK